jgi:hypothetical protein
MKKIMPYSREQTKKEIARLEGSKTGGLNHRNAAIRGLKSYLKELN